MLDLSNNYILPAYVHNITLDRISKLASFPKFSLEEAYNEGVNSLNSVLTPGKKSFDVPKYEDVRPFYEKFQKNANSTEIIEILYTEKKINESTKNELQKLNSIILEREDIENFDEEINKYIKSIKNNYKASSETEIICIIGANVAIASKDYWLNAYNDKESPWHFIFNESDILGNSKKGKFWERVKRIFTIVVCDVIGATVGAFLGSRASSGVGGGASAIVAKKV